MSQTTLAALRQTETQAVTGATEIGFLTVQGFEALQRMAKLFSKSSLVPTTFQGDVNLGNAAIALDMALRMRANPLAVMQNIYVVHGRPAWSAQFLIATLNKSGRFSALRYEFQGDAGKDDWGCRAVATELASGEKLVGPLVTIGLAKKEGWFGKNGSKWQSMPELMLRYRAASWFVRAYAPEIAMGLPEASELQDTIDVTPTVINEAEPAVGSQPAITVEELKKRSRKRATKAIDVAGEEHEPTPEQETGEHASVPDAELEARSAVAPEAVSASAATQAKRSSFQITCPRTGTPVDELDCSGKACREGCPEFS